MHPHLHSLYQMLIERTPWHTEAEKSTALAHLADARAAEVPQVADRTPVPGQDPPAE